MPQPAEYACPYCETVAMAEPIDEPQMLTCSHCGGEYEMPAAEASSASTDSRADELDGLRIRQMAAARRATYRARSYCIIAAFACGVIAIQLLWMAVTSIRSSGVSSSAVAYVLFAFLAVYGLASLAKRARALSIEARTTALDFSATPPDFSTLGDGSARWNNMNDVR